MILIAQFFQITLLVDQSLVICHKLLVIEYLCQMEGFQILDVEYLRNLFCIIDSWNKEYINTKMIDGSSWSLSIIYSNGNKKEYSGKSSYPNNFEAFERLNQKLINEVQNG